MVKGMSLPKAIFVELGLILLAIIYAVPLLNVAITSLSNGGFDNYRVLFSIGLPIGRMILNSVIITALQLVLIVVFSSMAAFAFSKLTFPFSKTLYTFIILTMSIPMLGLITPLFQTMKAFSLMNTYAALVLPAATFWMPVAVLIFKNYYDSLGRELMEATIIDGGGFWTCWSRVYFPIGRPATINVIVLGFMNSWNDYLNPLLFSKDMDMYTLPMAVVSLTTTIRGSRTEVVFACLVIMAIPSILVYLFLQDYLGKGMTAGSVKG
jgi:ABC-type glycerol-3-phosphate transport system permease component